MKAVINTNLLDQNILDHIDQFEEFKKKVFDALYKWENKVQELTEFVQKQQ